MRRLREHQLVTLDMQRPSLSIECLVLSVDGNEGTLEPVDRNGLAALPEQAVDALLVFEHRSQLITLRGVAGRIPGADEIRFGVTDKVLVPQRRRYARIDVQLPVRLIWSDGETLQTQTRDLSADGVLLDVLLPDSKGDAVIELSLPDGEPPVAGAARFIRNVAGGTAMRYIKMSDEDRERLTRFVRDRKREILRELRTDDS